MEKSGLLSANAKPETNNIRGTSKQRSSNNTSGGCTCAKIIIDRPKNLNKSISRSLDLTNSNIIKRFN